MQFLDFVQNLQNQSFKIPQVLGMQGHEYAPWFINLIYTSVQKDIPIKVIDCSLQEYTQLTSMMQMSFLGMNYCYVLLHVDECSSAMQHNFKKFLATYHGPHYIVLWGEEEGFASQYGIEEIALSEKFDYTQAKQISMLFSPRSLVNFAQFLKQVYSYTKKLSLYELAMLWQYSQLVGKQQQVFMQEWLPKIIPQDSSLFLLSQYYFNKEREKFAELWNELFIKYNEQFWCGFWSDQLYKAYFYVFFMRQKNYAYAKGISSHLPYSFINNDWTLYNTNELAQALNILYQIDHSLKNGKNPLLIYNFPLKGIYNQFKA